MALNVFKFSVVYIILSATEIKILLAFINLSTWSCNYQEVAYYSSVALKLIMFRPIKQKYANVCSLHFKITIRIISLFVPDGNVLEGPIKKGFGLYVLLFCISSHQNLTSFESFIT